MKLTNEERLFIAGMLGMKIAQELYSKGIEAIVDDSAMITMILSSVDQFENSEDDGMDKNRKHFLDMFIALQSELQNRKLAGTV